ncbi:MAG: type II toxin-antitoxin system prevent-host-death family antitoxin [Desulfobacteraceae bacterium]|nr:type II toxin-antitoxin system prevent-host-death family antitoxin [Desulfobacteraceae bacterium]
MKSLVITQIEKNIPKILSTIQAGEMISVTFKGREVARLVPPTMDNIMETARKKLALLRKTAVVGDVSSPLDDEWKAVK